jgi:hypothetical protein
MQMFEVSKLDLFVICERKINVHIHTTVLLLVQIYSE